MAENVPGSIPSTASIAGHPIHPMLVPFPIAFLVGVLATDLVYWGTADGFWARTSIWLVGAGVVMAGVAAIFGLIDFLTIHQARRMEGWVHLIGNLCAVVLALANWLIRLGDQVSAILPVGLILSAVTVALLLVTGWMGGELAYRYRIGVVGAAETLEAPPFRRPPP